MAAAVTSAWSKKPGAWALDSEANEAELQTLAPASSGGDTAEFPSLTAAISAKAKKKNKPQTMSLSEFSVSKTSKAFTLTRDEAVSLPTGPRQRTAEELADGSRLGGGFRSYGSSGRDERERERKREVREPMGPSRADEADDWGSTKRNVAREGGERRERGFFGGGSESKADESDNWGSNKVSSVPSRFDGGRERRGGVGFGLGGGDAENWVKKKEEEGGRKFGGAFDSLRERRGGVEGGDSENWGRKREEGGVGGERVDRPRLKLQPRTVPVGEQNGSVVNNKTKGSNPFGEARPREEVLKEKGKDWKEIDEKLESMKVKDAEVAPFGKRGFGKGSFSEVEAERSWRKADSGDVRPQSADKVENGVAEEAQDLQE